jgi:hypothetical protein
LVAVGLGVVTAISLEDLGSASRFAYLAFDRGDGGNQGEELVNVGHVGRGDLGDQRKALGFG